MWVALIGAHQSTACLCVLCVLCARQMTDVAEMQPAMSLFIPHKQDNLGWNSIYLTKLCSQIMI